MTPEDRVTSDRQVLRWKGGARTQEDDILAVEQLITFHVEPLGVLDIIMAPTELREFIIGHLYSEGVIDSVDDLLDMTVADRGDKLEALVELNPSKAAPSEDPLGEARPPRWGLVQTECGTPPLWPTRPFEPIGERLGMAVADLVRIPVLIRDRTELFNTTGAFHYAFIVSREGEPGQGAYDIGRHTAVDKVIGKALLEGTKLDEVALFTTGRISTDVASKCARAGIPLVISRSAPLTGAVALANQNGMGLVGFLRGGRFNVYSGQDHIVFD
jgi:FdhD protein